MNSFSYQPTRLFTPEQANATLPLVRAICTDMSVLSRELLERKERLALLRRSREAMRRRRDDPYSAELEQIDEELQRDHDRLRELIEELQKLGVEAKGGVEGLVDFPCQMDGRVVFLCWKLGESEVQYWHELDAGFMGRQPLLAESVEDAEHRS